MRNLLNNLDQSTLSLFKVLSAVAFAWATWRIFVKDVGLKTFIVKFAWFVIDLLDPEFPERKPKGRSAKKRLHKRRS